MQIHLATRRTHKGLILSFGLLAWASWLKNGGRCCRLSLAPRRGLAVTLHSNQQPV
jgi:hypothetical protein